MDDQQLENPDETGDKSLADSISRYKIAIIVVVIGIILIIVIAYLIHRPPTTLLATYARWNRLMREYAGLAWRSNLSY
ncbi:hypothetical protein K435DRAFT_425234 [Dendrothele bispora CBS 962.96]|uniref:Uncharacterized protein n=1 Tax=Dendrothele bispora (strain CBS 962.96) TaxID=1314807 RepID=A0A4S8L571_DENBC|nr:hypothetical protein K435DRAFT_425234 [Dendrothele bispora CBS 962.96]